MRADKRFRKSRISPTYERKSESAGSAARFGNSGAPGSKSDKGLGKIQPFGRRFTGVLQRATGLGRRRPNNVTIRYEESESF
jgi:hypothetical protein